MNIIHRYIIREVIPPFVLSLVVLTFLLMLPPIMEVAEDLIAKGVDGLTIVRMMLTLLPQGLGVTIPMALLVGILMGMGRLSGDRETVAMQACGISISRILAPVMVLATMGAAVTCYILVVSLPDANQAFRDLSYTTIANRAEGEVRPRVFHDDFPDVMLYAREVALDGSGWSQVFLADTSNPDQPNVYLAERGRIAIDRGNRTVDVVLEHGTGHRSDPSTPGEYEVHEFEELVIGLNAETAFPRSGPQRGLAELTIPQLQTEAMAMTSMGQSAHQPIMHIHRKFSIPIACLVFALLGVGFGVTSRKDGRLASFALGIGVIFTYYVVMYTSEAMAKGQLVSPHLAMWIPNVLLGFSGLLLIAWRSRSVERRFRLPFLLQRDSHQIDVDDVQTDNVDSSTAPLVELSPGRLSGIKLLDWYVTRFYLTWVFLSFVGLLGIFYISTFIDLSDKLFKGQTTGLMLLEYFWYATPQFMYYVLPISALVSTLVTVGALTKTSELTVMKACGISLYRMAFPIFTFSLVWSGCLFLMSETFLAESNRRAEDLNHRIRTGLSQTIDVLNRRWLVTETGDIYHYLSFDPNDERLTNLSVYEFSNDTWALDRRTYAATVGYESDWEGENVWTRDFDLVANTTTYETETHQTLTFLSSPDFFVAETPEADLMSYQELAGYIVDLSDRGFDVVGLVVDLHRKVSFPFVTFILTLIAVPFAVTTGPRGALYGVGVGIGIAFSYWIILSVFGAFGSAGVLAPALAAWAPNLLFGASAGYFLLTVRT